MTFALISMENLKNKDLKLKQVECVVEIKGKLDPYQIQKIRDHVSDSVVARRKNINDAIAAKAAEAAEAKDPKKRKAIIAQVDAAIAKALAAFDKKMQQSISEFCEKDAQLAQAAKTGRWSYWVNTAWDLGSLVWNGSQAAGEAAAVGLGALKSLFDLCLDLEKFCTTQRDAWRGLEAQEDRLKQALEVIKKTKKGSPVKQSDIDKAEAALAPLGPKIDVLEKNTRALAGNLDEMLKEQIDKKLADKKVVAQIEKTIDAAVRKVTDYGTAVAEKRKAQKSAKDSIKTAMAKAQNDPWSIVTWALDVYGQINDTMDLTKESENLYDSAKKLKIVIEKAMNEEDG